MKAEEIQQALDDVFDEAVVFHGFADYMRDYAMIVHVHAPAGSGREPRWLRHVFKHCVSAQVQTTLTPQIWQRSLDERLTDYATGADLDGYVWGVKWHCLYPGGRVQPNSIAAQHWSDAVGIDFHEIVIETNAHKLTLICSDLTVTEAAGGYTPFRIDGDHDYASTPSPDAA